MDLFNSLVRKKPPERLYHYTSPSGLKGILTDKVTWASVIHYLNDAEEFKYAIDLAQGILKARPMNALAPTGQLYLKLMDVTESLGKVHICVFSLSETGDLLSQWRAYGGRDGGYSLGFRPDLLTPFLKEQELYLAPCTYTPSEQTILINEVIDFIVSVFQKKLSESKLSPERTIESVLPGYFFYFSRIAAIIKHPAFSEEREWRIVSGPIHVNKLDYRVGKSMLIPYLPIQLRDSTNQFPVDEVIVGPTSHQNLATIAVTGLLNRAGIKHWNVTNSKIPYREL